MRWALRVTGLPILSVMTWAPFVAALVVMSFARHRPLLVRWTSLPARRCRWSRRCGSTGPTTARPPASSSASSSSSCPRSASRICSAVDGMSALMCAADVDHHLRRRVRVVDGQGAQPGVLRAAAAPRHRRVRRVRLARPVRLLPVLRDRRAADVSAHRHLGIDRARCGRRASSAGRSAAPASARKSTRR